MASNRSRSGSILPRLDSLARNFRQHKPPPVVVDDSWKRAAVLVCLFEGENGDLRVVLTRRASTLSSYPGDVSLPGGRVEEGDDGYVETALREAKEEIGLDPCDVTVVVILKPFIAKSDVVVVPVIGFLSSKTAYNPTPNTKEVEAIFDAPLEMVLKDENRRAEEGRYQGVKFVCCYFDFEANDNKHVIWALTAVVLISTASLVYQRPPDFTEQWLRFWTVDPLKRASRL